MRACRQSHPALSPLSRVASEIEMSWPDRAAPGGHWHGTVRSAEPPTLGGGSDPSSAARRKHPMTAGSHGRPDTPSARSRLSPSVSSISTYGASSPDTTTPTSLPSTSRRTLRSTQLVSDNGGRGRGERLAGGKPAVTARGHGHGRNLPGPFAGRFSDGSGGHDDHGPGFSGDEVGAAWCSPARAFVTAGSTLNCEAERELA